MQGIGRHQYPETKTGCGVSAIVRYAVVKDREGSVCPVDNGGPHRCSATNPRRYAWSKLHKTFFLFHGITFRTNAMPHLLQKTTIAVPSSKTA